MDIRLYCNRAHRNADDEFYSRLQKAVSVVETHGKAEGLSTPDLEDKNNGARLAFDKTMSLLLPSPVVATAIRAWLSSKRRKVTIACNGVTPKIEFEGPDIQLDVSTIRAMIETLVVETRPRPLWIIAELLPESTNAEVQQSTPQIEHTAAQAPSARQPQSSAQRKEQRARSKKQFKQVHDVINGWSNRSNLE